MITLLTFLPILQGLLIAYFIFTFEPLQNYLKNEVLEYFNKVQFDEKNINHISIDIFMEVITCPYCLSFWITLLISFNFYFAVIALIIMKLIKKYLPTIL